MEADDSRVIPINIEEEMKSSYIDYSMSVIVSRALPDVRDGLKPVHRRVLYAMHELGLTQGANYKKSARVVGETLGKYHPHGDSSVYDTLVRMAQEFSMRYPLADGQGNFGSVDGDSAAAMRYTEARMTRIAEQMMNDIGKETVDTQENFDGTMEEPTVLPAAFPNMLVNGADGIAVGMATKIPPHNLGETIDATVAYIDDPDIEIDDLMDHLPAPDFPTGGIIYGYAGVYEAYHTGRGRVVMRAKMHEEEVRSGRDALIVTELPFQVNKSREVERIADRVRQERIEGIADLRDESDRDGLRIVIELKQGANAEIVKNQVYKHSRLQDTFGVNMVALVDGRPAPRHVSGFGERFVLADALLHLEWFVHVARESGITVPQPLVERTREESLAYYTGHRDALSPRVREFQALLFSDDAWVREIDAVYGLDSTLFGVWERLLGAERRRLETSSTESQQ